MKFLRNFKLLFATLVVSALAISCDGGANDETGSTDETKGTLSLSVIGSSVNDLKANVNPSEDMVDNYMVGVATAEYFESTLESDTEALAAYIISESNVTDFDSTDDLYVFNGTASVNLSEAWTLEYDTEYVVAAFGVCEKGLLTTNVYTETVTTDENVVYSPFYGKVFINEIYAYGNDTDWVELYNASGSTVDLNGMMLQDSDKAETAYTIENTTIESGKFVVFSQSEFGFGISKSGELVRLVDQDGAIVDEVEFPGLSTDQTYGRVEDGGEEMDVLETATKGVSNDPTAEPEPDPDTDEFEATIVVENITSTSADIYWTVSDSNQEYVYALFENDGLDGVAQEELMDAIIGMFAEQGVLEDRIIAGSNGGTFTLDSSISEYAMMIFAIDETHTTATSDLFRKNFSTNGGGDEPSGNGSDWFGTWTLTSASSEVDGGALSVEVIMKAGEYGADVDVYGWDISANRWIIGMPASLNAAGDLVFAADNFMTTVEGQGDVHFQGKGFVEGTYQDYYFITGDYDAMTVKMGADKESATTEGYEGVIAGDVPFTITAMVMTLLDGEDIYTFYTDESLGFDQSECLVGPYTLTKVSNNTTLPSSAPAKVMGSSMKLNKRAISFDVVKSAINMSVNSLSL